MWICRSTKHFPQTRRRPPRRPCQEVLEDRRLLSFAPVAIYPAGAAPYQVITADFNADGRPDVATAKAEDNSVSVLLANEDGTLGAAVEMATPSGPASLAAGDFDGNGTIDLVTANAGGDLSVFAGNGDGTFRLPRSVPLPDQTPPGYVGEPLDQVPRSVAVGDFDGDGNLDLAATGATTYRVLYEDPNGYGSWYQYWTDGYANVLLGDGGGAFAASDSAHVPGGYMVDELAVDDVNNDGRADIVTSNYGFATVFTGNGDGTLGAPVSTAAGFGTPALGDFDADGTPDLVTLVGDGNQVQFQRGNGDGSFGPAQTTFIGYNVESVAVGDVNGDGSLDIVAVHPSVEYGSQGPYGGYDPTTTDTATVLLGNGRGGFSEPITSALAVYPGHSSGSDVALADVNGDGRPDLVVTHPEGQAVQVALNDGTWVAAPRPPSVSISDPVVVGEANAAGAAFAVTLSYASEQTVTVQYFASGDSAVAGGDFTAVAGTLTFAPGETSKTVAVPVINDATDEYDETFSVYLSGATNASLATTRGLGMIVDDDAAPTVSIGDVSRHEGRKSRTRFDFVVTLSAPSGKDVTVDFETADGTATTADGDYVAAAGLLTFAPGETRKVISVDVQGDNRREPTESFFVDLVNAGEATIADGRGVGSILDDDARGKNGRVP